jgi:hypothetical protein
MKTGNGTDYKTELYTHVCKLLDEYGHNVTETAIRDCHNGHLSPLIGTDELHLYRRFRNQYTGDAWVLIAAADEWASSIEGLSHRVRQLASFTPEADWAHTSECGSPSCSYCGSHCPDCGVPHGYVKYLEDKLNAIKDLL